MPTEITVEQALKKLNTGKTKIIDSLTNKGVTFNGTPSLDTIAKAITNLKNTGSSYVDHVDQKPADASSKLPQKEVTTETIKNCVLSDNFKYINDKDSWYSNSKYGHSVYSPMPYFNFHNFNKFNYSAHILYGTDYNYKIVIPISVASQTNDDSEYKGIFWNDSYYKDFYFNIIITTTNVSTAIKYNNVSYYFELYINNELVLTSNSTAIEYINSYFDVGLNYYYTNGEHYYFFDGYEGSPMMYIDIDNITYYWYMDSDSTFVQCESCNDILISLNMIQYCMVKSNILNNTNITEAFSNKIEHFNRYMYSFYNMSLDNYLYISSDILNDTNNKYVIYYSAQSDIFNYNNTDTNMHNSYCPILMYDIENKILYCILYNYNNTNLIPENFMSLYTSCDYKFKLSITNTNITLNSNSNIYKCEYTLLDDTISDSILSSSEISTNGYSIDLFEPVNSEHIFSKIILYSDGVNMTYSTAINNNSLEGITTTNLYISLPYKGSLFVYNKGVNRNIPINAEKLDNTLKINWSELATALELSETNALLKKLIFFIYLNFDMIDSTGAYINNYTSSKFNSLIVRECDDTKEYIIIHINPNSTYGSNYTDFKIFKLGFNDISNITSTNNCYSGNTICETLHDFININSANSSNFTELVSIVLDNAYNVVSMNYKSELLIDDDKVWKYSWNKLFYADMTTTNNTYDIAYGPVNIFYNDGNINRIIVNDTFNISFYNSMINREGLNIVQSNKNDLISNLNSTIHTITTQYVDDDTDYTNYVGSSNNNNNNTVPVQETTTFGAKYTNEKISSEDIDSSAITFTDNCFIGFSNLIREIVNVSPLNSDRSNKLYFDLWYERYDEYCNGTGEYSNIKYIRLFFGINDDYDNSSYSCHKYYAYGYDSNMEFICNLYNSTVSDDMDHFYLGSLDSNINEFKKYNKYNTTNISKAYKSYVSNNITINPPDGNSYEISVPEFDSTIEMYDGDGLYRLMSMFAINIGIGLNENNVVENFDISKYYDYRDVCADTENIINSITFDGKIKFSNSTIMTELFANNEYTKIIKIGYINYMDTLSGMYNNKYIYLLFNINNRTTCNILISDTYQFSNISDTELYKITTLTNLVYDYENCCINYTAPETTFVDILKSSGVLDTNTKLQCICFNYYIDYYLYNNDGTLYSSSGNHSIITPFVLTYPVTKNIKKISLDATLLDNKYGKATISAFDPINIIKFINRIEYQIIHRINDSGIDEPILFIYTRVNRDTSNSMINITAYSLSYNISKVSKNNINCKIYTPTLIYESNYIINSGETTIILNNLDQYNSANYTYLFNDCLLRTENFNYMTNIQYAINTNLMDFQFETYDIHSEHAIMYTLYSEIIGGYTTSSLDSVYGSSDAYKIHDIIIFDGVLKSSDCSNCIRTTFIPQEFSALANIPFICTEYVESDGNDSNITDDNTTDTDNNGVLEVTTFGAKYTNEMPVEAEVIDGPENLNNANVVINESSIYYDTNIANMITNLSDRCCFDIWYEKYDEYCDDSIDYDVKYLRLFFDLNNQNAADRNVCCILEYDKNMELLRLYRTIFYNYGYINVTSLLCSSYINKFKPYNKYDSSNVSTVYTSCNYTTVTIKETSITAPNLTVQVPEFDITTENSDDILNTKISLFAANMYIKCDEFNTIENYDISIIKNSRYPLEVRNESGINSIRFDGKIKFNGSSIVRELFEGHKLYYKLINICQINVTIDGASTYYNLNLLFSPEYVTECAVILLPGNISESSITISDLVDSSYRVLNLTNLVYHDYYIDYNIPEMTFVDIIKSVCGDCEINHIHFTNMHTYMYNNDGTHYMDLSYYDGHATPFILTYNALENTKLAYYYNNVFNNIYGIATLSEFNPAKMLKYDNLLDVRNKSQIIHRINNTGIDEPILVLYTYIDTGVDSTGISTTEINTKMYILTDGILKTSRNNVNCTIYTPTLIYESNYNYRNDELSVNLNNISQYESDKYTYIFNDCISYVENFNYMTHMYSDTLGDPLDFNFEVNNIYAELQVLLALYDNTNNTYISEGIYYTNIINNYEIKYVILCDKTFNTGGCGCGSHGTSITLTQKISPLANIPFTVYSNNTSSDTGGLTIGNIELGNFDTTLRDTKYYYVFLSDIDYSYQNLGLLIASLMNKQGLLRISYETYKNCYRILKYLVNWDLEVIV